MNNDRRKTIADLSARISEAETILNDLLADLESVKDEERESFDNMPEGLQQSDNGQRSEAAADALDSAHSSIEEAIQAVGEAVSSLEEASE